MPSASNYSYKCSCCDQVHEGYGDLAFNAPAFYDWLSDADKAGAQLTSDTCVIGDDRFIRAVLRIPVEGDPEGFAYGVWVSLSQPNYERYLELFDATDRLPTEPWFGWFANQVPGYPDTLSLKTHVRLRPFPNRPLIELEPTDHPLALEQQHGISRARLREIWEINQHPHAV